MPITFHCQCGQRLSARDELAGKATKCPKCGSQLTIPAPKADELEPLSPQALLGDIPVRGEAPPQASPASLPATQPQAPAACPGCGAALGSGAVICVACGYNVKLGRRMQTETAANSPSPTPESPLGISPVDVPAPAASKAERRGWIVAHTGLTIAMFSLAIGGFGLVLLSIMTLIGISGLESPLRIVSATGVSRFGLVIVLVGMLAAGSTFFSLATGWMVCCGVPERTGTRPLIRGAAGCPLLMAGVVVLMALITAILGPKPSKADFGKPPQTRAEAERMQAEHFERLDAHEESAKTVGYVMKVLVWAEMLALVGGYAMFGYFLGVLGDYLGDSSLRPISYGLAGVDGAVALWLTLSHFIITIESPGVNKMIFVLLMLAAIATYGCLVYMSYRVLQAIQY